MLVEATSLVSCGGRVIEDASLLEVGGQGGRGGQVAGGNGPRPDDPEPTVPTSDVTGLTTLRPMLLTADAEGLVLAVAETSASEIGPEDSSERAVVVTKWAPAGRQLARWVYVRAGRTGAAVVDAAGELVVTGQLTDAVDFGGGVLAEYAQGYYVVWLDEGTGTVVRQATSQWGDVEGATPRALTADRQGNVYVAGFGWGPSFVFVEQYSAQGARGWRRQFPACGEAAYATDIEWTGADTVAVVGAFSCGIVIGDSTWVSDGVTTLGEPGQSGFLAELDAESGEPLFSMRFGRAVFDKAEQIDVTAEGHYRVLGFASGASEIGGAVVEAATDGSLFVADLNRDGVANWVEVGDGTSFARGSTTSPEGVTYLAGSVPERRYAGEADSAVFAVAPEDGIRTLWTAPTRSAGARTVVLDGSGNLWVSGEREPATDVGEEELSTLDGNAYLVRLESD